MSYKIKNNFGVISIDNEVVAKIAGLAAMDCYGIVGMAAKNAKDGIFQLLKKESLTKGIIITTNSEEDKKDVSIVSIDIHIIVEYGTNITAICESLSSAVKYNVEKYAGLDTEKINIFVEGVHVG